MKAKKLSDSRSGGKYRAAAVRRGLDLLFYVDLGMQTAWGIEDGARPGVQALVAQGWRSVSFLHGIGTSCVILAGDSASPFLQDAQGRLIVNGEGDEGGGCRWDIVSHRRGSQ